MVERVTLNVDFVDRLRLFHMLTRNFAWCKPSLRSSWLKSSNSERVTAKQLVGPMNTSRTVSICNPICHEWKCTVVFSDCKTSPLANSPCANSHSDSLRVEWRRSYPKRRARCEELRQTNRQLAWADQIETQIGFVTERNKLLWVVLTQVENTIENTDT